MRRCAFLKQLANQRPIDEADLAKMRHIREERNQKYGSKYGTEDTVPRLYSKREVKVGDRIIYGFIDNGEASRYLITFCRDEIGVLYEFEDCNDYIPLMKEIK
jgi:hypothetical protein